VSVPTNALATGVTESCADAPIRELRHEFSARNCGESTALGDALMPHPTAVAGS
jgi:hypothetical protein